MTRWIDPEDWQPESQPDPALGLSNLLSRLLAARGIRGDDRIRAFLDPVFYKPTSPLEMPGVASGVEELHQAINEGQRIGVWGDFDVDGQTSTTLLVSGLRKLGADVVYHIPVRATESHGIKIQYLKEFMKEGIDLLLTCDTGISAHEAIEFARNQGLRVVISDHHDLPEILPEAEAVINPKLLPDDHPLVTLPGVGVAYKIIEALFQEFNREAELEEFLDLVALGIVADIASLVGEARYLLQLGLRQLRDTPRLGLQAIYSRADLNPAMITEEEIGYVIGPRLNALGRLGDANPIVEFLTNDSSTNAEVTAVMLEELNANRKMMSDQVFKGALAELSRHPEFLQEAVIVLANEFWPPGVVGIVASRIVERFKKPAVLLQVTEDGRARGSARSVEGCDISAAINTCAEILEGFGGHPMAAGMVLKAENIGRFRKRLSVEVEKQLGDVVSEPELVIDAFVSLSELSFPLVKEVGRLGPFGNGNPPVRFAVEDVSLVSHSFLGRDQDHRKLVVEDQHGERQTVIWWRGGSEELPRGSFDLAFTARESYFRGEVQIQVVLEDFRERDEAQVDILGGDEIEIVDLRDSAIPDEKLRELIADPSRVQVWAEGEIIPEWREFVDGRDGLSSSETLVVWTVPPNFQSLQSAIDIVQPGRIILFNNQPGTSGKLAFLQRLAGLVKFVIAKKSGETSLADLVEATGQTELIVRLGLSWLEGKGNISVEGDDLGLQINAGISHRARMISLETIELDLDTLLRETRLFRYYFLSSGIDSIRDELK